MSFGWWVLFGAACRPPLPPLSVPAVNSDADADSDSDSDSDADADSDSDSDSDPVDGDGDGVVAGVDCDDNDANIYPGATEHCDGVDEDCDGVDPGDEDADGDGLLDCLACEASGWWELTNGRSGANLEQGIAQALVEPTCTYDEARIFMFNTLDIRQNGLVVGVYTGAVGTPSPESVTAGGLNTEHTWPQSQGADVNPARCDLHHLYPTLSSANSRRNNHPFGLVATPSWTLGTAAFGTDATGTTVFQPPAEHRGNVARSLLYFGLQYGYSLDADYKILIQQWAVEDPVDAVEIERTLAIQGEQGPDNPLVLCSFLVGEL